MARDKTTSPDSRSERHPRPMVVLHWLTVLALVAAAGFILTRDEVAGRVLRGWLMEAHRHAGLIVLVLFVLRVVVRIRVGTLKHEPGTSLPLRVVAACTHVALYLLLLGMPLLGWALSSAQGNAVHFFGLTLPALVGEDEDLADTLQAWHLDAAWLLLGLACMHIDAALWHHLVLRDGVLRRMLPGSRP